VGGGGRREEGTPSLDYARLLLQKHLVYMGFLTAAIETLTNVVIWGGYR